MGRPPSCPLPHVDPAKVQVDVTVWSEMQKAVTDALSAQRDISAKIADAIAAERAAAAAQRSEDATGIQGGNLILREQLAQANADAKDRDKRILELLERVDKLQRELADLKGSRAEVTLADNREQRQLELARAQIQSVDNRFSAVMAQLSPLIPLVIRLGAAATAAKMASVAMPAAAAPSSSTEAAAAPHAATPAAASSSEPEVIQAVAWTHNRIEEWKTALCDLIRSSTPQTAAAFRFWIDSLGVFAAPPEALPEMVRALMAEAGPELVQRLQTLTAAARPS